MQCILRGIYSVSYFEFFTGYWDGLVIAVDLLGIDLKWYRGYYMIWILSLRFNSILRYWVEDKMIKFVSTSRHVIFCLLYEHTNDDVFDNFLKISDYSPKISEDSPKLFRRPDERFRTFSEHFWRLPKIAEDDWRRYKDVSIIDQQI